MLSNPLLNAVPGILLVAANEKYDQFGRNF